MFGFGVFHRLNLSDLYFSRFSGMIKFYGKDINWHAMLRKVFLNFDFH